MRCCPWSEDSRGDSSRTSCRHLVTYLIFLIVTTIVAYGMRTDYQYYLNKALSVGFTERLFSHRGIYFDEISSVPDIWAFLSEVALPNLFPTTVEGNETFKFVLSENYLLGLARLRQLRVRNDSCKIHEDFREYIFACYDEYSSSSEDRMLFGPMEGTPWTHHTAEQLDGTSYWGRHGFYEGSGYYEDLGPTYDVAVGRLQILIDNDWIRRATRVVFLDFAVYNANVNLFSIVKFAMEMPVTGGVWPSLYSQSVKLLRYVNAFDYFVLVCELFFCCFTVYYLVEEIVEVTRHGFKYLRHYWNLIDLFILLLSLSCLTFSIYRTVRINEMLEKLLNDSDHYPSFVMLGKWQKIYDVFVAILVFLCYVKIFKYLKFNKTMTELATTLSKCAKDVSGFVIMFFIVFLAFVQLGYLLFGSHLYDFSRFHLAMFALFRVILGDFDFESLEKTDRVLGPLYFISFIFLVFFILLNMFLAIISDTYSDVKSIVGQDVQLPEFVQFLKKMYAKLRIVVCKKTQKSTSVKDGPSDEVTNDTREVAATPENMSNKSQDDSDVASDSEIREEIERLSSRLDDYDHELRQIQEVMLHKLETIETLMDELSARHPINLRP